MRRKVCHTRRGGDKLPPSASTGSADEEQPGKPAAAPMEAQSSRSRFPRSGALALCACAVRRRPAQVRPEVAGWWRQRRAAWKPRAGGWGRSERKRWEPNPEVAAVPGEQAEAAASLTLG